MRMAANNHTAEKKNSADHQHHPTSKNRNGQRHQSDPTQGSTEAVIAAAIAAEHGGQQHHIEPDLFSILSSMHLNNQLNSNGGSLGGGPQVINMPHPVIVTSRKRKILDGGGHGSGINGNGAGKMNGMRPPAHRRTSDDDDEAPLQTPQCSQSGYADEEDRHAAASEAEHQHSVHLSRQKRGFMSPPEINDIVDDNLASDFDGSLSGLGVDIHAASFSMSEALNALPNLSISSSHIFKQEVVGSGGVTSSPTHHGHHGSGHHGGGGIFRENDGGTDPIILKTEPASRSASAARISQDEEKKNYGALDLSNDEAYLPDTNPADQDRNQADQESALPVVTSFAGSVSRESTPASINFSHKISKSKDITINSSSSYGVPANLSASNPNLSSSTNDINLIKSQKVILPLQQSKDAMKLEKRSYETIAMGELEQNGSNGTSASNFQYILAASTSLATKLNEPSITYLNQGQPYELRMKKLGDLSPYRKRLLKCVLRICFHERRLQYMETEQISHWSSQHPGERIIDVDLPLSYGVFEPVRDSKSINTLAFQWDPTRDTGIYIKVNCISTEFTPKKHGGEKGVPFRLQVETYDNESRIHAAGCILQVFKLKGADRKHKQDRDKISKRPFSEQEKYSPSFESTVLADLPLEHIYVPANLSRSGTPVVDNNTSSIEVHHRASSAITNVVVSNHHGGSIGSDLNLVQNQSNNSASTTNAGGNSTSQLQRGGGGGSDSDQTIRILPPSSSSSQTNTTCKPMTKTTSTATSASAAGDQVQAGCSGAVIGTNGSTNHEHPLEVEATIEATASVSQVSLWLMANRFSSLLSCFCNFNGRDMLRLSRDELIALCGTSDGIRLYNSLHSSPILPRVTFYVGAKEGIDNEFSALYLEELTVSELIRRLGEAFNVEDGLFTKSFFIGPKGILVRMTDSVVKNFKPDTVFQFSLRSPPGQPLEVAGGYEVVFEELTTTTILQNENNTSSPSTSN